MKGWIVLGIALATSQAAGAQVGRNNDPFVFCSEGVPDDGWVAVDPAKGTWRKTRKHPDLKWVPVYESVCPQAQGQGEWIGSGSRYMPAGPNDPQLQQQQQTQQGSEIPPFAAKQSE